ncbi:MAG: hypothetical protein AAF907_08445 [Planctomycetota bacterium]
MTDQPERREPDPLYNPPHNPRQGLKWWLWNVLQGWLAGIAVTSVVYGVAMTEWRTPGVTGLLADAWPRSFLSMFGWGLGAVCWFPAALIPSGLTSLVAWESGPGQQNRVGWWTAFLCPCVVLLLLPGAW